MSNIVLRLRPSTLTRAKLIDGIVGIEGPHARVSDVQVNDETNEVIVTVEVFDARRVNILRSSKIRFTFKAAILYSITFDDRVAFSVIGRDALVFDRYGERNNAIKITSNTGEDWIVNSAEGSDTVYRYVTLETVYHEL